MAPKPLKRVEMLFEDCFIEVDGDKRKISADCVILSAQSDVLRKTFETEMKEESQHSIKIEGAAYEEVKAFIDYFYSGWDEHRMAPMDRKLLQLAHKYDVEKLMQYAERSLAKKMTLDNWCETVLAAHAHERKILYKFCKYFARNTDVWDKLVLRKDWAALKKSNGQLTSRLIESYFRNIEDDSKHRTSWREELTERIDKLIASEPTPTAASVSTLFTDCILQVDGEEVRAHRSILSYYSPKFREIFLKDPKAVDMVVIIENARVDVVKAMIQYCYGDTTLFGNGKPTEIAIPLFILGRTYEIDDLVKDSQPCVLVTVDNWCSAIVTANENGLEQLLDSCMSYVRRGDNMAQLRAQSDFVALRRSNIDLIGRVQDAYEEYLESEQGVARHD